jgi:hypothetical protein
VATDELTREQQLQVLADLNIWRARAEKAEAALSLFTEGRGEQPDIAEIAGDLQLDLSAAKLRIQGLETVAAKLMKWFDGSGSSIRSRWTRIPPEDAAEIVNGFRALLSVPQGETRPSPEPPWPVGASSNANAKRAGWFAFFAGQGRESAPFPQERYDLRLAFRTGWDAAQKVAALAGEGQDNA